MDTLHISNLNEKISSVLSVNFLDNINMIGEVISVKPSGKNYYLTIKDINEDCQINCTLWGKDPDVKQGDRVEITGKLAINKKNISLYVNIKNIKKVDDGNIMIGYEKLKQELIGLGYNDNKKVLNKFPTKIGIITAKEGAAIQDILQTFKLDNFIGNVNIYNAIVQGKQCPSSVIAGIDYFIEKNDIDILLIARGGGSFDDLVGFSDRELLDKIFISRNKHNFITISAIGHQIDNQLTDLVCDYFFATPSIAAKYIVEKQKEYITKLEQYKLIYNNIMNEYNKVCNDFNNINIENAKKYYYTKQIKDYYSKIEKYKNIYNDSITQITKSKERISKFIKKVQPIIQDFNSDVVLSIYKFIDKNTEKVLKNNKLFINFADGNLEISYKIIGYEIY